MTEPVTPVLISPLPDAPLITDAPAAFNDKAFPFAQALDPFGEQINAIATATNTNAVASKEKATASAASASASAASAVTAEGSVTAAANQVALAVEAKNSAETAAAAAGAAAGLPTLVGKKGQVLSVTQDETGVEWAPGALELGGAYIGFKKPDAGVFLDPDIVYLKSSYPNLAALVGTSSDGSFAPVARTMPASVVWRSVTFGNGLFVAVGHATSFGVNTICATSPDGINWTQRAMPSGVWYCVTFGNGLFVAMSGSGTVGATSTDGINWTQRVIPAGTWIRIAYGNGLFVAINNTSTSSTIATSPDGATWTVRTMPALSLIHI